MCAVTAERWSRTSRRHWSRSTASAAAPTHRRGNAGSRISAPGTATCSTSGRAGDRLTLRQSLVTRYPLGDGVKRLLVDGVDRHLRAAVERGIVKRADLEDYRGQARPPRNQVGATFGAELARHRAFNVAAAKLPGRSLGEAEAANRHQ